MSSLFDSEDSFQKGLLGGFEDSDWDVVYDDMSVEDIVSSLSGDYVRKSLDDIVLEDVLRSKILELNEDVDEGSIDRVLDEVMGYFYDGSSLVERNKSFCSVLRSGVSLNVDGEIVEVSVFDFEVYENNDFVVFEEFEVDVSGYNRRPDLVGFVNGLPLVVVELKSVDNNSFSDAILDLEEVYQEECVDLFVPNVFCVAADQNEVEYGSIGCGAKNYHSWDVGSDIVGGFVGLFDPSFLLRVLEDFVFYKTDNGDIDKIIPMVHQFEGVNCVVDDIREGMS